ncbi:MAG: macro domain-containing protein [Anaerolineaceae bacterium]
MDSKYFEKNYPNGQRVEIVTGDLTRQEVDAIVNAANSHLAHGGGVAGAIVRRGGQVIQQESNEWVRQHGPLSHEKPAYTGAGDLPCRYIIHAVGPVWGDGDEERKLGSAILGSLNLAAELGLRSIAFPAISTGIFGFPLLPAAEVFAQSIDTFLSNHPESPLNLIRIVLMDETTQQVFIQALKKY